MKRATLSFLGLAGLVLCAFFLRQALQNDSSIGVPGAEAAVESQEEDETRPQAVSGYSPPTERGDLPPAAAENEALADPNRGTFNAAEGPAEHATADEPSSLGSNEVRPLRRYQDDDALAMRRARQIELVSEARQQARTSLEAAEERGDVELAAQTRGVLRRLQLRLDALEAAASAVEPY